VSIGEVLFRSSKLQGMDYGRSVKVREHENEGESGENCGHG
jgi:hypothetical protein